ncbi:hypothetical protein [Pantoea dispersa]|uniref:hypothetical protein n=1 Tax=Pantoea dispersa TaxID=59814 RepID=UPI0013E32DF0|nr:hypothetical protein [Pantoea dispersa]
MYKRQAYQHIEAALEARLAALRAQKALAFGADALLCRVTWLRRPLLLAVCGWLTRTG